MAKPKRKRISAYEREYWCRALNGASSVMSAAAARVPEPNLIAAVSLLEAAVANLSAWPSVAEKNT